MTRNNLPPHGSSFSSDYGITRPYADNFLNGTAPDETHDEWRWTREKHCFNKRIYDAVSILAERQASQKGGAQGGVIFLKQMAKFAHLFDFETNFETDHPEDEPEYLKEKCKSLLIEKNVELIHKHVLLIRDPLSVLGSWMGKSGDVHQNNPHPEEVGIVQLLDVYSKVLGASMNNNTGGPIVIDSDDLASNPIRMLSELCDALGIEYRSSMLKWKSGEHECDGPWARWWYHDVWESSGWDAAIEEKVNNEDEIDKKVQPSWMPTPRMGSGNIGVNHPRTRRYHTVPEHLMPMFRMSLPAYTYLKTCTLSYREQRAIASPPSGKLYEDPRNEHVLVYVGSSSGVGRILPRDMAGISPFDSSVQGGDGENLKASETLTVYGCSFFHLCCISFFNSNLGGNQSVQWSYISFRSTFESSFPLCKSARFREYA
jgi:hypothetical protein